MSRNIDTTEAHTIKDMANQLTESQEASMDEEMAKLEQHDAQFERDLKATLLESRRMATESVHGQSKTSQGRR